MNEQEALWLYLDLVSALKKLIKNSTFTKEELLRDLERDLRETRKEVGGK